MVFVAPSTLHVFFFFNFDTVLRTLAPFEMGSVFLSVWIVCMNAEYVHTQSYFQLNSFVHSVLNKCPNINGAMFYFEVKWQHSAKNKYRELEIVQTPVQHAMHILRDRLRFSLYNNHMPCVH